MIKIMNILKTWTLIYIPNPKTVFSQEHGVWNWYNLEQVNIFYTVNNKHEELLAIQEVTENTKKFKKDKRSNGTPIKNHR